MKQIQLLFFIWLLSANLFAQASTPSASTNHESSFNNPLYTEFERLGALYGIDMSFTKQVETIKPFDPALSQDVTMLPIFCSPEKSLDVILLGDSTLSWGVIPRVVEGLSHRSVGMFAFRAMLLNRRTMNVARRVINRYLKKDGIVIFGFTVWTQLQYPDTFMRGELLGLEAMSDTEFETMANRRYTECARLPSDGNSNPGFRVYPTISLNSFQVLKWDYQTFTLIGPFQSYSTPSSTPASPFVGVSDIQRLNAQSLISIPHRKAFLITMYENDFMYVVQRSYYNALFKKDLELIDLGISHPLDKRYATDGSSHPVGDTGFYKSVMIADWLRKNFHPPESPLNLTDEQGAGTPGK